MTEIEIETDSVSLPLLIKLGNHVPNHGLTRGDLERLMEGHTILVHVSRPEERPKKPPAAKTSQVESGRNELCLQQKLPFPKAQAEQDMSSFTVNIHLIRVIKPPPKKIHKISILKNADEYFNQVQRWRKSSVEELFFFQFDPVGLEKFKLELISDNKAPLRTGDVSLLFKTPELQWGEHLILVMHRHDGNVEFVHAKDTKKEDKLYLSRLYTGCLERWISGQEYKNCQLFKINLETWRHFVVLYDRMVEEKFFQPHGLVRDQAG